MLFVWRVGWRRSSSTEKPDGVFFCFVIIRICTTYLDHGDEPGGVLKLLELELIQPVTSGVWGRIKPKSEKPGSAIYSTAGYTEPAAQQWRVIGCDGRGDVGR